MALSKIDERLPWARLASSRAFSLQSPTWVTLNFPRLHSKSWALPFSPGASRSEAVMLSVWNDPELLAAGANME